MKDWKLRLSQNQGLLVAMGSFILSYGLYSFLHPRGFSASLFGQNANESFVLVMAAMAQTVPVLTGGLDLSVGPVTTLVDCVASRGLGLRRRQIAFGVLAVWRPARSVAWSTDAWWSTAACNRSSPRWPRAPSTSALRFSCGPRREGRSTAISPRHDVRHRRAATTRCTPDALPGRIGWQEPTPLLWLVLMALVWTYFRSTKYGLGAYAIGPRKKPLTCPVSASRRSSWRPTRWPDSSRASAGCTWHFKPARATPIFRKPERTR